MFVQPLGAIALWFLALLAPHPNVALTPGDVFAGVLAAGWRADPQHALLRAVTAGALATLIPGAGNCAPYDEAIEDTLGSAG